MQRFRLAALMLVLLGAWTASAPAAEGSKIHFKKMVLDTKFRSEGVAAGDFNRDGQMDVAAGSVWYEAPDWKMHAVADEPKEFDPKAYSNTFCNFTDDLNRDGWDDLIVVDFPGAQTWWFENPQGSVGPWKQHECVPVTNNESPHYVDVDGDGKRELIYGDAEGRMCLARPAEDPYAAWIVHPISVEKAPGTERFSHGLGTGDVNLDGRIDVLVTQGWWEQPEEKNASPWKFHPAALGEHCANMHARDFNGDGKSEVLSSSAHAFGVWLHEQLDDGWKTRELDHTFSQSHAMCLEDMNGDDLPDFVTGKRFWAHTQGDPDVDGPALLYWYELAVDDGKASWTPHQIDRDSGVGTQFEVADMNGDHLPDVVVSNKKGVFCFLQERD